LEEARGDPRLDEPGGLRGDAGVPGDPRAPRPRPGPDQASAAPGAGDDALGCPDVPGQGTGRTVPPAVARGAGSALAEDAYAYGDASDQEPGDGAQGGGNASPGVQPDRRGDGGGGAGRGDPAADAELQGFAAHDPGVRGGASVRPRADRGGPAAPGVVDRPEAGR